MQAHDNGHKYSYCTELANIKMKFSLLGFVLLQKIIHHNMLVLVRFFSLVLRIYPIYCSNVDTQMPHLGVADDHP